MEKELNIKVKECGLLIDENNNFLERSPDGLLDDAGLVEIKCPYSSFGLKIDGQIVARKF